LRLKGLGSIISQFLFLSPVSCFPGFARYFPGRPCRFRVCHWMKFLCVDFPSFLQFYHTKSLFLRPEDPFDPVFAPPPFRLVVPKPSLLKMKYMFYWNVFALLFFKFLVHAALLPLRTPPFSLLHFEDPRRTTPPVRSLCKTGDIRRGSFSPFFISGFFSQDAFCHPSLPVPPFFPQSRWKEVPLPLLFYHARRCRGQAHNCVGFPTLPLCALPPRILRVVPFFFLSAPLTQTMTPCQFTEAIWVVIRLANTPVAGRPTRIPWSCAHLPSLATRSTPLWIPTPLLRCLFADQATHSAL